MSALRALRTATQPSARRLFSSTPARPLARTTLIGHLVATPEAITSANGRVLFRYALGVNTPASKRNEEPASFFNITAFTPAGEEQGPLAQLMGSLDKGTLLFVEADTKMVTLPVRDGEERPRIVVNLVQRTMQILSPKKDADSS